MEGVGVVVRVVGGSVVETETVSVTTMIEM